MKTKKQKYEILDAYGNKIFSTYVEDASKGLSGATLETFFVPSAKIPGVNFSSCVFYKPLFEEADLSFCIFFRATLSGANFKNSVLRHADFRHAIFSSDEFGWAGTLEGADLTDALLDASSLKGVDYNEKTIFPMGYSPEAPGLILRDSSDS